MKLDVIKTSLEEILHLRNLFFQENNFQIRYNSRPERGLSNSYMIVCDQGKIGYAAIAGYTRPVKRAA